MSRSHSTLSLSPTEVQSLLGLFPRGVLAVDLETTGLSPLVDKIIEIAAVKIKPDGEISYFHQLINPLIEIPEFTRQFHGLSNEDLKSSPTIKRPLREFWDFCERLPVIAHNSIFDLGYLIKASHDFQLDFPPLDVFDSCRWARAAWKPLENSPKNYKLSTLSAYCDFELQHHVAMDDTMACLKIMARVGMLPEVDQKTCQHKSFIFRLSEFDRNDCFNYSTRLQGLTQLVQEKNLVTLDVKGTTRYVRPIGLMPQPKGPVLFAEDLLSGMNKTYLLKKIKGYARLDACYWKRPEEITV